MKTTISTLDDDGRVNRSVEVDQGPTDDMSALDITKKRLSVIERMALERATDAVCATCNGTGIDPHQNDTGTGSDQCPACEGRGVESPPAPPAGLSTPAIDHDKVAQAAEQMNGGAFTAEQAAATKALIRELDAIGEERRELNSRKAEAKAAFVECCPDVDFSAVMVAYVVYTNAETEAAASKQMTRVAETVGDVAELYQPALW